jgi:hypothetical protein
MLAFDYPSRADKLIKHLVFLFIQQALFNGKAAVRALLQQHNSHRQLGFVAAQ